eukprot:CAMPEP_0175073256 /NCGR_PEP_ID=MMETSP0052_2-20121109/20430_1 /TAXON_ID=51329 ORGANISM="Polytomella parva, Strain SAG 63-3" /NCGR_SAMPLE_ID=MMETSP0052_2 /ASSEMBLY_ACC=CAM_ASM_000194 /LENGTH=130 /DNA_ID=CAMNT_0016340983 /DNA_START=36 /DNA_END=425 /DNA_ORIENTATION=+
MKATAKLLEAAVAAAAAVNKPFILIHPDCRISLDPGRGRGGGLHAPRVDSSALAVLHACLPRIRNRISSTQSHDDRESKKKDPMGSAHPLLSVAPHMTREKLCALLVAKQRQAQNPSVNEDRPSLLERFD